MTPAEIKQIRSELACNARELGEALGVDQKTVLDWESGERFPTKRNTDALLALREKGPAAIPRRPRGKARPAATPYQTLADRDLWKVVRKLIAHPDLRDEVAKISERYPDPAEE